MKKYIVLVCAVVMSAVSMAKPTRTQSAELVNGLYYEFKMSDRYALLVQNQEEGWDGPLPYYSEDGDLEIVVEQVIHIDPVSPLGGGTPITELPVEIVDTKALYLAECVSLTFKSPSNIRIIRELGLAQMPYLEGTLTLPESLKLIETKGIYSGDEGYEMPVTKLVIPAGIDSLGMSSVVLNEVEEIEFLGTTPPKVYNQNGITPWNIDATDGDYNTPKDITITYPTGADEAYKSAPGISTYFTQLQGGTAIDNAKMAISPATKSLRNNMLIIERNGVRYDAIGQRL